MTAEHTVKDPVCGMSVNPHSAEHRSEHGGKTWYFCSSGCKSKFDGDPGHYLSGEQKQDEPVAPGTMYTCPMHPEIRQQGPGDCPICGMALEPEQVSLDDGPSAELKDMTRRFWIGLVLALPVQIHNPGADGRIQFTKKLACIGNPFNRGRGATGWLAANQGGIDQATITVLARQGNRIRPLLIIRNRLPVRKLLPRPVTPDAVSMPQRAGCHPL